MGFDTLRILKNPFELVKFRYTKIVLKVVVLTLAQSILLNIISGSTHTDEYETFNFCYQESLKNKDDYNELTCISDIENSHYNHQKKYTYVLRSAFLVINQGIAIYVYLYIYRRLLRPGINA